MVEGQLRPWAWALLQICGRTGPKMPEVSSLREQLVSVGFPLQLDAATAILPEARNASAHEDYLWDEESRQSLRVGDLAVANVEDLEEAANRAYTFVAVAEGAWRWSGTILPELARLLDTENPPSGLRVINERKALDHFGTSGLSLRRWTHENRRLTVVLDKLPRRSVDPCFQAAIWVSRHLESAERVVVKIGGGHGHGNGPPTRRPRCQLPGLEGGRPTRSLGDVRHVMFLVASGPLPGSLSSHPRTLPGPSRGSHSTTSFTPTSTAPKQQGRSATGSLGWPLGSTWPSSRRPRHDAADG